MKTKVKPNGVRKNGAVFTELRDRFDRLATAEAKERLKMLRKSPPIAPGRRPQSTSGSIQVGSGSSGFGGSSSPMRGPSPKPSPPQVHQSPARAPQRSQSPAARSPRRPESPLRKTGSSVDYTSTQWDSDEYESDEDEEDEKVFQARGPMMMTPSRPGAAPPNPFRSGPQQPSPAPRGQQVKTVVSKPLNTQAVDDDDDWQDSESESDLGPARPPASLAKAPQLGGSNVAQLSRSIEMQLAGRKQNKKPAGGVDTMANKQKKTEGDVEDFDSDSDWDVSPVEDDEPVKPKQRVSTAGSGRGSHVDASVSSNTYGTSLWGSSSKVP